MRRGIAAAVIVASLLLGVVLFRGVQREAPGVAPVTPPAQNVVLIIVDTVRFDRLGCSGNPLGITPRIDRFALGAVRFEQAYSHAPWTLPSVASLFTSQYPQQHGAGGRLEDFSMLGEEAVTLAELFRTAGAATAAVTNVLFITETFGTTQGFDFVDSEAHGTNLEVRRAGPTTDVALSWLDRRGPEPFFLLVHYFDAHLVYDPPRSFRERFAAPQDRFIRDHIFGRVAELMALRKGATTLSPETVDRLEKLYNGEVAYVDSEVGRLLAGLTERGLDEDTIVVLVADHGEEFLDHGGFEHGHTLYDELLHVPLIIRAPALGPARAGGTVRPLVRLIDVAPTLCELAGVAPADSFEGESLVPLLQGREGADRAVLSQGNMWGAAGDAWRKGRFKLIREQEPERIMVFDLLADPEEANDLAGQSLELRAELLSDLDLIKRSLGGGAGGGVAPTLSPEDVERLRSLGYIK